MALRRNATSRTDYIMAYSYSNTLPVFVIFSGFINDEVSYLAAKNGRSIALSSATPEQNLLRLLSVQGKCSVTEKCDIRHFGS